ncbi:MAG: 2Fe-2S iron-sulfur cluster-binding protein, partial [Desulfofustis sp.]
MTGKKSEHDGSGSQVRVTFEPMGILCTAPAGQTVLAAAATQGIDLRSECGGKGRCGKCQVEVTPSAHVSAVTDNESRLLPEALLNRNGRLACQARIKAPLSVLAIDWRRDSGEALG